MRHELKRNVSMQSAALLSCVERTQQRKITWKKKRKTNVWNFHLNFHLNERCFTCQRNSIDKNEKVRISKTCPFLRTSAHRRVLLSTQTKFTHTASARATRTKLSTQDCFAQDVSLLLQVASIQLCAATQLALTCAQTFTHIQRNVTSQ